MDVAAELKRIDREIELERFRVQHSLEAFGVSSNTGETIPEGYAAIRSSQNSSMLNEGGPTPIPTSEVAPSSSAVMKAGSFRLPTKMSGKQSKKGWGVAMGIAAVVVLLGYAAMTLLY